MSVYINENRIAILLATYNGSRYIEEQINSLISQSFQDWHLYIHDDDSTDETKSILANYEKSFPQKISILDGEATGGARNNFFYLLEQIESPLYMFCDQDDVWLPNKIQTEVDALQGEEMTTSPILVFTDLKIVDDKLQTIAGSLWRYYNLNTENIEMKSLILQNVITGCTVLINKKMRDMMISYHCIDNVPMHDKWAAMIALQFGKTIRINQQTVLYRQHEDNSIGAKRSSGFRYICSKLKNISRLNIAYSFTRCQAREFCETFQLNDNNMLYKYGELDKKNKIERLIFYFRNKYYTNRISQIIGMIISG